MKKNLLLIGLAGLFLAVVAATTIGVNPQSAAPIIASTSTTVTNAHPSTINTSTTNPWPCYIIGGDIVTNMTMYQVPAGCKDTTFQLSCSPSGAVGANTGQQAALTIYRNVSGGTPTNGIGTAIHLEQCATLTAAFAANATAEKTVCTNLSSIAAGAGGAITTFYLGILDVSTMTNGVNLTNYSVYANSK